MSTVELPSRNALAAHARQPAVHRCPADTEHSCDGGDVVLAAVVHRDGGLQLLIRLNSRSTTVATTRAAARPARVRSLIRSRSNSAREAKTWKMSRPPGVDVSILSVRLRTEIPRLSRSERSRSGGEASDRADLTARPRRCHLRGAAQACRRVPADARDSATPCPRTIGRNRQTSAHRSVGLSLVLLERGHSGVAHLIRGC